MPPTPIFIPRITINPILIAGFGLLIILVIIYIIVSRMQLSIGSMYIDVYDPYTMRTRRERIEHVEGNIYKSGSRVVIIPSNVKPFVSGKRIVWPAVVIAKRNVIIDPVEALSINVMGENRSITSIDELILELYNAGIIKKDFRITPNVSLAIAIDADDLAKKLVHSVARTSEEAVYTLTALTLSFKEYEKLLEKYIKLSEARTALMDKIIMGLVIAAMAAAIAYVIITGVK